MRWRGGTHSITYFIVSRPGVLGVLGVLGVGGLNEQPPKPSNPPKPPGDLGDLVDISKKVTEIAHFSLNPPDPLKLRGFLAIWGLLIRTPKPPERPNPPGD